MIHFYRWLTSYLFQKNMLCPKNFKNKTEFVQKFQPDLNCLVVCAWGDQGAAGRDLEGKIIDISAYKPTSGVIDTIGAGDTFNATVVACLSQGKNLAQSLDIGCKVAE